MNLWTIEPLKKPGQQIYKKLSRIVAILVRSVTSQSCYSRYRYPYTLVCLFCLSRARHHHQEARNFGQSGWSENHTRTFERSVFSKSHKTKILKGRGYCHRITGSDYGYWHQIGGTIRCAGDLITWMATGAPGVYGLIQGRWIGWLATPLGCVVSNSLSTLWFTWTNHSCKQSVWWDAN